MISKPLLKQSYKANRVMWLIITFAVCFMLCTVMLIAGSGNIEKTRVAVQDAMVKSELDAQTKSRAMNYYDISYDALEHFDGYFAEAMSVSSDPTTAYGAAVYQLNNYLGTEKIPELREKSKYAEGSEEAAQLTIEVKGIVFGVLNFNPTSTTEDKTFDNVYKSFAGEDFEPPRYDLTTVTAANRAEYRSDYVRDNLSVFLSGQMVNNINTMLELLSSYGITAEKLADFGYTDYGEIKTKVSNVLVSYIGTLNYRVANLQETPGTEEWKAAVEHIKDELLGDLSGSLLSKLPQDVASALQDIGSMDLYGLLVGSIFFRMAGLLLPIIYMIMVANALIAGQVDSGSMAYVLSTSTKRKTVIATQALFLVGSLLLMFIMTCITSIICYFIVDVNTKLNVGKLMLINLGAFLAMFAMSGISFLASAVFNRSKRSMAIGGGLNMFFLVATMLGLFGSPVIPSVIRMDALNAFNYVSIISLFDVVSILNGTLTFLWKFAILIAIGVSCYVAAKIKFVKKDLPL